MNVGVAKLLSLLKTGQSMQELFLNLFAVFYVVSFEPQKDMLIACPYLQ